MVMRDIEGKALRERATETGGEEVSIIKAEVKQSSLSLGA
jgi:hypothetical protein